MKMKSTLWKTLHGTTTRHPRFCVVNRREVRQIQQLQQRANRNAIDPLMEVIYEEFAERLSAISFRFIVTGWARRSRLRDPDGPIGGRGYTRGRESDARRAAAIGGADR